MIRDQLFQFELIYDMMTALMSVLFCYTKPLCFFNLASVLNSATTSAILISLGYLNLLIEGAEIK